MHTITRPRSKVGGKRFAMSALSRSCGSASTISMSLYISPSRARAVVIVIVVSGGLTEHHKTARSNKYGDLARCLCPCPRLLNESARSPTLPVRAQNIHPVAARYPDLL